MSASHSSPKPSSSLRSWIEERTGLSSIVQELLEEPIPGGARWAYIFGSGLLFLFVSQVLTGVALAVYYVPAANDAHLTVEYIVKVVSGGAFLRSLHSYGASAFIVVLLLHIMQTFFYGAYKQRRELVWFAGCALFALILGMAFTGYLLPWDQKAYFATAVGTNVMGEAPGLGNVMKRFLRGGDQLGTVTLSRFFVLHVFVLPGLIIALIAAHVYLFRKAGPAGPTTQDPARRGATEAFYPKQFGRDVAFSIVLMLVLGALAYFFPVQLGPKANPADASFLPRPEWYFLFLFEWLKFWPGKSAVVGVVLIPTVVAILFVAMPLIDRRLERSPLRRPLAIGGFCLVLGGMIALGILSRIQDRQDPLVWAQMTKQERATHFFMIAPFQPLETGTPVALEPTAAPASSPAAGSTGAPPTPTSSTAVPPVQKGKSVAPTAQEGGTAKPKTSASASAAPGSSTTAGASSGADATKGRALFISNMCTDCHGTNAEGTDNAPTLSGLGPSWPADRITKFLENPSDTARENGMPAIPATSPDLQPLVAYILSLQH